MKSVLVIGMGRFGIQLASKMTQLGNDVMAVDKDEALISQLSGEFTETYIGDCRNLSVIKALGPGNYDICFVAVDDDFQSSLETTLLLKECGAQCVVSCAKGDRQDELLKKIGADDVIDAEREIGIKTAIRYNANRVYDFINLNDEYSIFELAVRNSWIGKSIAEINVRREYKVNIIAVKQGDKIDALPLADYVFLPDDSIIVIGKQSDISRLTSKK